MTLSEAYSICCYLQSNSEESQWVSNEVFFQFFFMILSDLGLGGFFTKLKKIPIKGLQVAYDGFESKLQKIWSK